MLTSSSKNPAKATAAGGPARQQQHRARTSSPFVVTTIFNPVLAIIIARQHALLVPLPAIRQELPKRRQELAQVPVPDGPGEQK